MTSHVHVKSSKESEAVLVAQVNGHAPEQLFPGDEMNFVIDANEALMISEEEDGFDHD